MPPTAVTAFEAAAGDFAPVETPHVQQPQPAMLTSNHAHSLLRKWYAFRWNLARTVFAKPVPFLTTSLQLKLGDLIVTLPVAAAFLAINAVALSNGDVGGGGTPTAIVVILVFALAVRNNSILLTATGLPFDRALFYHKFFAGVAWLVAGLHGLTYLLNQDAFREDGSLPRQLSGALTFYGLSGLVVFAFEPIRRRFFDVFHRMHVVLVLMVVVFGIIHGAAIILIGFVPWVLDLLYRYAWRSPKYTRENGGIRASEVTVKLVANDVVRVRFARSEATADGMTFRYEAGQYAFLCIPAVSSLEWHPFTIASAPHEPHVTFYIKALGDWTKKLAVFAQTNKGQATSILVDGPYGAVSIEMDHYSHFAFFSGGIGVTPMRSLANDLYYTSKVAKSRRFAVEKAWFVWAVRDREMVQALVLDDSDKSYTSPTWFPSVLSSASHGNSQMHDAFIGDFYLTNKPQDLSQSVDQELALCLKHTQRPDVAKILTELGESAKRTPHVNGSEPRRVGVLVCGPAAMVSEVVAQSQRLTKSMGVIFDVHEETFAW